MRSIAIVHGRTAITTSATAADLPVKSPPRLAPAFSWTGCYVGGYLGGAKVGDWYGMVTGRLGYAWDRTLIYIKGGAAFVPTRSAVVDACQNITIGCGNWLISTGTSHTVTTWTLGGGIEWAFAPNWSVKGEYMFIALGADGGSQTCGDVTTPSGTILAGGPFCFNHSFSGIHTAKIGLNYRFGGDAVVGR